MHGKIRNILTSTLNTLDMESSERLLACCNSLFRRSSRGLESAGDDSANDLGGGGGGGGKGGGGGGSM